MIFNYDVTDLQNAIANDFLKHDTRSTVATSDLTDSWLLSANSGEYKVSGTSAANTFIDGVDSTYGVLRVVMTEIPTGLTSEYGYIEYFSNKSTLYVRVFRIDPNAIVWRTPLKKISGDEIANIQTTHNVPYTAGANLPSGASVDIKERNGIVCLTIMTGANQIATPSSGWYNLITIGSDYRPSELKAAPINYQNASGDTTVYCQMADVGTNGVVRVYLRANQTAIRYLTLVVTYIL